MNAATRIGGMRQAVSGFWSARNKREQNLLAAAIVVVVLGLVYALFIDPAVSGREDLAKRLPGLRQQAAEVQSLAKETSASAGKANGPTPPPMTKENIEASLTRSGLKAQNVSVSGELAKVQLNGVSFANTVSWLTEAQQGSRMSVVEANVEVPGQGDTVNATLTLRQQRSEAAQ